MGALLLVDDELHVRFDWIQELERLLDTDGARP
jgi:hypothetical protein